MPPRTRGLRVLKASKENIDVLVKNKVKAAEKCTKPTRRPLADKTNSASDENTTLKPQIKAVKTGTKLSQKVVSKITVEERPRRCRRLPTRYVENQVLNNLSNSKELSITPHKPASNASVKNASKIESPLKTPNNGVENSLVLNRQRRVSRLPSKFDETVSPDKLFPIHLCHSSTPLVPNPKHQTKRIEKPPGDKPKRIPLRTTKKKNVTPQKLPTKKVSQKKVTPKTITLKQDKPNNITPKLVAPITVASKKNSTKKQTGRKLVQNKINELVNADVGRDRVKRIRKPVEYKEVTLSPKLKSPVNLKPINTARKIISQVNSSLRIFEEKRPKKADEQDVYEFTFDPSEEPQKKKRKKVVNKKPLKPKQRVYKNNYEKNLARALADLKSVVATNKHKQGIVEPSSSITKLVIKTVPNNKLVQTVASTATSSKVAPVSTPSSVVIITTADVHPNPVHHNKSGRRDISNKNHASIRVEDIAADFESTIDHHDDINYSPANSPKRIEGHVSPVINLARSDDPLNLRNELSFFDEQPVASSSMNMSTRNPMATPWRVEFERLPIKWQANTYVKSDMTPALESSYINNFDESKKKNVYTNMVEQTDEIIPDIIEGEAPKLKQTSIISFIKEVVERSACKKKKGHQTPTKSNSLFDVLNTSTNNGKDKSSNKNSSVVSSNNASSENDASTEGKKTQKRKNDGDINPTPVKVACKDKENTLFGFDDSENQEQENISPNKVVNPKRLCNLRTRSGAVLKELNKQTGPMRGVLPVAMKSKLPPSSDFVDQIYGQIKSAADAPVLLEKHSNGANTNVTELPPDGLGDEDSQSIHLFEDVEIDHHLKPSYKSYGKTKKVTFMQQTSDSDDAAPAQLSSDDDADDLSFHLPEFKTKKPVKKKKTKKQVLSKKEKAEVDAWAASFNSMCEDIEEFDLVVE